ncbi:MAG: hypothetical protein Ct9H300mP1_31620 [Planctomycetaceae bacterium]|nr:MAG: hypothetical protein Ct9H300mP1_31620 [Planctomycetaceae bacterium]
MLTAARVRCSSKTICPKPFLAGKMSGARAEDPSPDHDRVRSVMHGGFAVLLFDWLLIDIPVVAVNSIRVE